jgi:hypothetical protein
MVNWTSSDPQLFNRFVKQTNLSRQQFPPLPKIVTYSRKTPYLLLLADPIQSQISSMLQAHVRTIHDSFIQRLEEAVKAEREKREEALMTERREDESAC